MKVSLIFSNTETLLIKVNAILIYCLLTRANDKFNNFLPGSNLSSTTMRSIVT